MRFVSKKENGAFSIDAVLGITFFMLAILAIMFMSLIIRLQANVQYALGQTAKEISGYYYLMDKIGLTSVFSGVNPSEVDKKVEGLNGAVGNVIDFSSSLDSYANEVRNTDFLEGLTPEKIEKLQNSKELDSMQEDIAKIDEYLKDLTNEKSETNAIVQLKSVIQIFGRSLISKGLSYIIAPKVCNVLMPKYLTSGDVREYYENVGIDPNSVDFTGSQLLLDGRSIKLTVAYEVDMGKLTFGMVNTKMNFHQTAVTAAWIRPDGDTKKYISGIKLPAEEEKKDG